jgi:stage III sporulation protein SpoIIIAA
MREERIEKTPTPQADAGRSRPSWSASNELESLLDTLPPQIAEPLRSDADRGGLIEVVLDLGRLPEARYVDHEVVIHDREITEEDLHWVVTRIGDFTDDNRAGITRTLHRISCMRNRKGRVVGLTCRVGRAITGTIDIILDVVESGKSILLLGRPGVGKTTMLREVARVIAEKKRVIVVDTSNEIGGDGDIPHPGIGRARRMQVSRPDLQHAVMIEAVENHMPETIIIDEIGTELESAAARTIAERGVQLIGTAHGTTLENLMMNPTLSDLIGGIQSVTLGDEEARRRGTQKSILERKAPPTFDVVVEIMDWQRVALHSDVGATVDSILRVQPIPAEIRFRDDKGVVHHEEDKSHYSRTMHTAANQEQAAFVAKDRKPASINGMTRIYPYGVGLNKLEQAVKEMKVPAVISRDPDDADLILTLKSYYRKKPQPLAEAESASMPIYVLRSNSVLAIENSLASIFGVEVEMDIDPLRLALQETEAAISHVLTTAKSVELQPQSSYIRRLQHQMAEKANLISHSKGKDPNRRVRILKGEAE